MTDAGPAAGGAPRRLSEHLARRPGFSWRADASVPAFDDSRPLIIFDGVRVLCSSFARFVVTHDPDARFLLTAAQSRLGQALYRHFELDPVNFESNLLLSEGRASAKMEAFAGIVARLGLPWRLGVHAAALPAGASDWLYDRVAQNRYRLFGQREVCVRPDLTWRHRVIE